MRRAWFALSSLLFALTLPAYAGGGYPAPAASGSGGAKAAPPAASSKAPLEQAFAAEVLILHATNDKKGIDPRIGKLPELGKAPFSTYDSYQLVDRARMPLKSDPQNLKLPNGRTFQVRLLEVPQKDSVRL